MKEPEDSYNSEIFCNNQAITFFNQQTKESKLLIKFSSALTALSVFLIILELFIDGTFIAITGSVFVLLGSVSFLVVGSMAREYAFNRTLAELFLSLTSYLPHKITVHTSKDINEDSEMDSIDVFINGEMAAVIAESLECGKFFVTYRGAVTKPLTRRGVKKLLTNLCLNQNK